MCDTVVATSEVTADGVTVFGKNTDREPNEAHQVILVPARDYPPESQVRVTYIEIPQVEHTYAVLLAKPFWIWGAEMGANEHGVTIGNEAVFTKIPYVKKDSLIGMDLLRLGLERGSTAYQALMVITDLLAAYGQGGNCGFEHPLYYHNSFILADPREAWVLETAGPHWAAKKIKGIYTISNGLTLQNEWDLASPDLVSFAVEKGWCKSREDFDFARCYSDLIYTQFSKCRLRCQRSNDLLFAVRGKITVQTVMATLRDHGQRISEPASGVWNPDFGLTGATVCMHAGFGPVRGSQTVGSMVSHLHPENPTHFLTATAAPCTSLFKPVWMDTGLPDLGADLTGVYDFANLFWRHERLHRATLQDYRNRIQLYHAEREELEREFVCQALELADKTTQQRVEFTEQCFVQADQAEERWLERIERQQPADRSGWLYQLAWKRFNRVLNPSASLADYRSAGDLEQR